MQYDKLGLYIKEKRKKLNVSLNKFAFDNNIEPAILSRIENLKQGVKLDVAVKIASGFKQTLGEFITEFENQK